ncbi:hypothetical protein BaRGS_00017090 [Batillaria attramentaria]|uniref:Uncharacterized protein n=1 Tax=Batillaria attramentaria TaxID=370345 RepID=A0ABD0KXY4_9CAEN
MESDYSSAVEGMAKEEDRKVMDTMSDVATADYRRSERKRKDRRPLFSPDDFVSGKQTSTSGFPVPQKKKRKLVRRNIPAASAADRPFDVLPDGTPFSCDLCQSPYVCNPLLSKAGSRVKRSRHMPSPWQKLNPLTGKLLTLCNACGRSLDRPRPSKAKVQPSQEEKEAFFAESRAFASSLATQLQDPDGEDDSMLERARELLTLYKEARKLSAEKVYSVDKMETKSPEKKRMRSGTIGLGNGMKRSRRFEAFILEKRVRLKRDLQLCERATQRILSYSNNFLHKKLKTEERGSRVVRQKGKAALGLLESLDKVATYHCCVDKCVRMVHSHRNLLQQWRKRAVASQTEARRVLAEMLTPSGGVRSNCYKFISWVTGCSNSTIGKVRDQMRRTKGDREPPQHGLYSYWQQKGRNQSKGSRPSATVTHDEADSTDTFSTSMSVGMTAPLQPPGSNQSLEPVLTSTSLAVPQFSTSGTLNTGSLASIQQQLLMQMSQLQTAQQQLAQTIQTLQQQLALAQTSHPHLALGHQQLDLTLPQFVQQPQVANQSQQFMLTPSQQQFGQGQATQTQQFLPSHTVQQQQVLAVPNMQQQFLPAQSTQQPQFVSSQSTQQQFVSAQSMQQQQFVNAQSTQQQQFVSAQSNQQQQFVSAQSMQQQFVNAQSSLRQHFMNAQSAQQQQCVNAQSTQHQQSVNAQSMQQQQFVSAQPSQQQFVNAQSTQQQQFINAHPSQQQFVNAQSTQQQQFVNAQSTQQQQFVNAQSTQQQQFVNAQSTQQHQFVNAQSTQQQQFNMAQPAQHQMTCDPQQQFTVTTGQEQQAWPQSRTIANQQQLLPALGSQQPGAVADQQQLIPTTQQSFQSQFQSHPTQQRMPPAQQSMAQKSTTDQLLQQHSVTGQLLAGTGSLGQGTTGPAQVSGQQTTGPTQSLGQQVLLTLVPQSQQQQLQGQPTSSSVQQHTYTATAHDCRLQPSAGSAAGVHQHAWLVSAASRAATSSGSPSKTSVHGHLNESLCDLTEDCAEDQQVPPVAGTSPCPGQVSRTAGENRQHMAVLTCTSDISRMTTTVTRQHAPGSSVNVTTSLTQTPVPKAVSTVSAVPVVSKTVAVSPSSAGLPAPKQVVITLPLRGNLLLSGPRPNVGAGPVLAPGLTLNLRQAAPPRATLQKQTLRQAAPRIMATPVPLTVLKHAVPGPGLNTAGTVTKSAFVSTPAMAAQSVAALAPPSYGSTSSSTTTTSSRTEVRKSASQFSTAPSHCSTAQSPTSTTARVPVGCQSVSSILSCSSVTGVVNVSPAASLQTTTTTAVPAGQIRMSLPQSLPSTPTQKHLVITGVTSPQFGALLSDAPQSSTLPVQIFDTTASPPSTAPLHFVTTSAHTSQAYGRTVGNTTSTGDVCMVDIHRHPAPEMMKNQVGQAMGAASSANFIRSSDGSETCMSASSVEGQASVPPAYEHGRRERSSEKSKRTAGQSLGKHPDVRNRPALTTGTSQAAERVQNTVASQATISLTSQSVVAGGRQSGVLSDTNIQNSSVGVSTQLGRKTPGVPPAPSPAAIKTATDLGFPVSFTPVVDANKQMVCITSPMNLQQLQALLAHLQVPPGTGIVQITSPANSRPQGSSSDVAGTPLGSDLNAVSHAPVPVSSDVGRTVSQKTPVLSPVPPTSVAFLTTVPPKISSTVTVPSQSTAASSAVQDDPVSVSHHQPSLVSLTSQTSALNRASGGRGVSYSAEQRPSTSESLEDSSSARDVGSGSTSVSSVSTSGKSLTGNQRRAHGKKSTASKPEAKTKPRKTVVSAPGTAKSKTKSLPVSHSVVQSVTSTSTVLPSVTQTRANLHNVESSLQTHYSDDTTDRNTLLNTVPDGSHSQSHSQWSASSMLQQQHDAYLSDSQSPTLLEMRPVQPFMPAPLQQTVTSASVQQPLTASPLPMGNVAVLLGHRPSPMFDTHPPPFFSSQTERILAASPRMPEMDGDDVDLLSVHGLHHFISSSSSRSRNSSGASSIEPSITIDPTSFHLDLMQMVQQGLALAVTPVNGGDGDTG